MISKTECYTWLALGALGQIIAGYLAISVLELGHPTYVALAAWVAPHIVAGITVGLLKFKLHPALYAAGVFLLMLVGVILLYLAELSAGMLGVLYPDFDEYIFAVVVPPCFAGMALEACSKLFPPKKKKKPLMYLVKH